MRFVLTKNNFKNLPLLGDFLAKNNVSIVKLAITKQKDGIPSFVELMPFVNQFLDNEKYFNIILSGFPFCVVHEFSRDHISSDQKKEKEKSVDCLKCRFNNQCGGFPVGYFEKFSEREIAPQLDIPNEIVIEVEARCNFNCKFCFNRASFARNGRIQKNIPTTQIKKIINEAAALGIKNIRFTGGEPLLRNDIVELCKYAKGKGLYVKLNTNGSLINEKIAKMFAGFVDNVLISIESGMEEIESRISGNVLTLEKKIQAIKILKKAGVSIVRIGTVLAKDGVDNFEKIAAIAKKEEVSSWEWYRMRGGDSIDYVKNLEKLMKKMIKFGENSKISICIANPLPFCAVKNAKLLSYQSLGAFNDDGNNRLIADPRGFFKPDYCIEKDLGNLNDIMAAWNHDFMKKIRNLKFLPKVCKKCAYVQKCRGGSRSEAFSVYGKWDALDPLANPELKKKL